MSLAYLTIPEAQARLRASANDSTSLPTEPQLEFLLTLIEQEMNEALQWRPAPTSYRELTRTNERGIAFVTYTPVIKISSVMAASVVHPGYQSSPAQPVPIYSSWLSDNRLETQIHNAPVQIEYVAGFHPIPPLFGLTAFQILNKVLKTTGTTGDLSFLSQPFQQVTSISLPGGLSKSFSKVGGSGGGSATASEPPATELSQLLKPLDSYRRRFIFSQGTCDILSDSPVLT